ncbi:MAG: LPS assembly lipoprotein LptE [Porticoccaceae bacterium]|jgi:LPS-assembly lipoprotein|nr:LPS assembly lipoprotein LptE [Porticoccaceae bacterium]
MKYKILLMALTLIVSSCGWQLRDTQIIPSSIGSIYVSSSNPNSALITELKRALNTYGVSVASNSAGADYAVVIVDFRQNHRTASLNASARVAEYQLNEDVDFYITDSEGNQITPLSTASVERVYEFSEDDILASDNEEKFVRDGMREDIVRQILNRLRIFPQ